MSSVLFITAPCCLACLLCQCKHLLLKVTERNQDPGFFLELESAGGEMRREIGCGGKKSSAEEEMKGECDYGYGEEVEERWADGGEGG